MTNNDIIFLLHYTNSAIPVMQQMFRTFPKGVDLVLNRIDTDLEAVLGDTTCSKFKEIMKERVNHLCDFVKSTAYKYVVFIDSDIIFNINFIGDARGYSFLDYLKHTVGDYDMVAMRDPNKAFIYNTGVWIIKINGPSRRFFREIKEEINSVDNLDNTEGGWPQTTTNSKMLEGRVKHGLLPADKFICYHENPADSNFLIWHVTDGDKVSRMKNFIDEMMVAAGKTL